MQGDPYTMPSSSALNASSQNAPLGKDMAIFITTTISINDTETYTSTIQDPPAERPRTVNANTLELISAQPGQAMTRPIATIQNMSDMQTDALTTESLVKAAIYLKKKYLERPYTTVSNPTFRATMDHSVLRDPQNLNFAFYSTLRPPLHKQNLLQNMTSENFRLLGQLDGQDLLGVVIDLRRAHLELKIPLSQVNSPLTPMGLESWEIVQQKVVDLACIMAYRIKQQMIWRYENKTKGSSFTFAAMVSSASVFYQLFQTNEKETAHAGFYMMVPVEPFQAITGVLEVYVASQNDTLKVTGKTVRVDWDREKRIFIVTGRYGIPYWSERPEQDAGGKALED